MVNSSLSLDDIPEKMDNALVQTIFDPGKGKHETVIVLPERGEVKVLNEVGGEIWELIDGQKTLKEISTVLIEKYDVSSEQIESDVIAFIQVLIDKKMVRLCNDG